MERGKSETRWSQLMLQPMVARSLASHRSGPQQQEEEEGRVLILFFTLGKKSRL